MNNQNLIDLLLKPRTERLSRLHPNDPELVFRLAIKEMILEHRSKNKFKFKLINLWRRKHKNIKFY